jgi:hypothetical protein
MTNQFNGDRDISSLANLRKLDLKDTSLDVISQDREYYRVALCRSHLAMPFVRVPRSTSSTPSCNIIAWIATAV